MIIKFDHISYISARRDKEKILRSLEEKGYQYRFREDDMDNPPAKKKWMEISHGTHDIYYYDQVKEMPIELIFSPSTGSASKVQKEGNSVYVSGCDALGIIERLRKIGFRSSEWDRDEGLVRCNIKGLIDKQDYWLMIDLKKERDKVFLDSEGYGCITFFVDSFKDLINCTERGGVCATEPFEVCVNGQTLKIVFYKDPNIDIYFEFCVLVRSDRIG